MERYWFSGLTEEVFKLNDCVVMQNHLPIEDLSTPESEWHLTRMLIHNFISVSLVTP